MAHSTSSPPNALDHVEDVDASIREMSRVTADNGTILLMVVTRHKPTAAEPHWIDWDIVDRFPGCVPEWTARNGLKWNHDVSATLNKGIPYRRGKGLLRARLHRAPEDR